MSTRILSVGADTLWAEDTGGAGVPLVLLHPGITDSEVWDRSMPLLGGQRVIRFDRRGYGRSPVATEAFRPVDDLVAVLDAYGIDRAHLVGNSMGGSLDLAARVPDAALVRLDTDHVPQYRDPEAVVAVVQDTVGRAP